MLVLGPTVCSERGTVMPGEAVFWLLSLIIDLSLGHTKKCLC